MPLLTAPTFEISVLSEHHLQALVSLSGTAAAAHDFHQVLDVAADAARSALDVDSLSVSRWEFDTGMLRTLIVSEDGLAEDERHPVDESYAIADFPLAYELLSHGRPHVNSCDDAHAHADPAELKLLAELGMESSAAVPIVYEGRVWGELYVATGTGRPRVSAADVAFLQAVAAQLAVALGRAEHFSQVSRAAYEDELTGLANRRAFEDRLGGTVDMARAGETPLTLVLGDLNNLKLLNDSSGHQAGDRALRAVGRALAEAVPPGATAARVGGDEFCALLPGHPGAAGEALASAVADKLSAHDPPLAVAWGVASLGGTVTTARDLFRAADEAQYEAKRRGGTGRAPGAPRNGVALPSAQAADLLTTCLDALDATAGLDRLERIGRVAATLATALRAPRWAVVHRDHGGDEIATLLTWDRRLQDGATVAFDDRRRPATAFPALERLMSRPCTQAVTRESGPAAEQMLLDALGLVAVVGGSAATPDGIDGLIVYADRQTLPLAPVGTVVRALLAAA